MRINIQREALLKPLQMVCGVVERRQTLPILSNLLLVAGEDRVALTGTDLEVEMVAEAPVQEAEAGEVTLPARKFLDICRTLPEHALLDLKVDKDRAVIRSGKSRFTLATLPAAEFPRLEVVKDALEFAVPQRALRELLDKTQFSMAHQDVRYYLNGLLLEVSPQRLRAVATDGHRLAMCDSEAAPEVEEPRQVIVPRKGVMELARLLEDADETVQVRLGSNHLQVRLGEVAFTSKLIDGRFPDYERVLPQGADKQFACEREALRQAFLRASVLSNEKYRGIRLQLAPGTLRATVHNPEQEEAEEEMEVEYSGPEFEIGFNVSYLLDALAVIRSEQVTLSMVDANSSCLMQGSDEPQCKYVIMPMRL